MGAGALLLLVTLSYKEGRSGMEGNGGGGGGKILFGHSDGAAYSTLIIFSIIIFSRSFYSPSLLRSDRL